MADEPSDACSRTDEDGAKGKGGWNNKRKSTQAYSYPNKKHGFVTRNERERYVICVFAVVVFVLIYLLIEEDEGDDEDNEDEDEDKEARADLLKLVVDCFIATKAWAKLKLGPGNTKIEEILGMLQLVPGYDEAVKAKEEATKSKRMP